MQSKNGGSPAELFIPRPGEERRVLWRQTGLLWGVALLWLGLLVWSAHLVVNVGRLRTEMAERTRWAAQAARLGHEVAAMRNAYCQGGPTGARLSFPPRLRETLVEGRVAAAAPVETAEGRLARERWRAAERLLVCAADEVARAPSDPARRPALEQAARAVERAIGETDDIVGRGTAARTAALAGQWDTLYLLGAFSLVGVGALALLVLRAQRLASVLRLKERRFRTLVQTAPHVFWSTDRDGRIVFVNEAVRRVYGYAPEEMMGRPFEDFLVPEIVERDRAVFRGVLGGKTVQNHETTRVRKDGSRIAVLVSATRMRDSKGRTVGAMGTATDITELRETQQRALRSERLQAVAMLSGGFAHDFNNLLTVILGQAEVVQAKGGLPPHAERRIAAIQEVAERARRLTHQLLAFARRQTLKKEVIDLAAVVRQMDELLRRLAGDDFEVRTELPDTPVRVLADWTQVDQVIMNLVVNARDAMPAGGRISIRVLPCELGSEEACALGVEPGAWVTLEVSDTGIGMSEEVQKRMFEPFFTTKETGKGTGLGLATVHGVVHQHGGCVAASSAPGQGTTVRVLLPAAAATCALAR